MGDGELTAVQRGLDHHLATGHAPGRVGEAYVCPDCAFTASEDDASDQRSGATVSAERRIPEFLRRAKPETRERFIKRLERQADDMERAAAERRAKARALRVYGRRVALGMGVEDAADP